MQDFFKWYNSEAGDKTKPWLILGKGPSFCKRNQFDLSRFNTLSLNHVVREQPVKVAHVIDLDVIDTCSDSIRNNSQFLVMPWFPHVNKRAGTRNLCELTRCQPTLQLLDKEGRLLWYNLSTGRERHDDSPLVQVKFFSAEAAINLLAQAGVRTVRSLGIDGGTNYSQAFGDLKDKTLLANGWSNFDRQFEGIARTILSTGVDYAPLDIDTPVRVYVAATEAQMLSVKVLEYSIRKHASMSVQVLPLHLSGIEIPKPSEPKNHPRTPFSFQRFLIPALTNYQGKAIYLDSDMQVFKDIRTLWNLPFREASLLAVREPIDSGRRPQFSVMLLDCSTLPWDIRAVVQSLDGGQFTYEQLLYEMSLVDNIRAEIHPAWNSLERYVEGETALIHYTDMNTQPWVSRDNPLGYLWARDLFEALDNGFISLDTIKDHILRGYIRPSLLYQIEHRLEESLLLPRMACSLDKDFVAPFQTMLTHGALPWSHPTKWFRAVVRHQYQKSLLYRLQRHIGNRFAS